MYIWTPDEGELISYRDAGDGFSVTVTVESEDILTPPEDPEEDVLPHPEDFTVDGLDESITFSTDANTWTVSATKQEAAGIFPVEITYLQTEYDDSVNVVDTWDDLPEDAKHIIKLETKESSPFVNTFTVTARDAETDYEETKTYSITIIHDYSANGERLSLEVEKRK